jgi:hypothetical protein
MDRSAVLNNPTAGGGISSFQSGGTIFETPFERKLRQRARRERWSGRWHKVFGGSQPKQ